MVLFVCRNEIRHCKTLCDKKNFKTHSGEVLNIELQFNKQVFRKSESFTEAYRSL